MTTAPGTILDPQLLRIGEVAKRTGVTTRTLRYWEEQGVLRPVEHRSSGERLYSDAEVDRITHIRELQDLLGFTLAEIRVALDTEDAIDKLRSAYRSGASPTRRRALLGDAIAANEQLLERVDDRLERVRAFRQSAAEKADRLRRRARELDAELDGLHGERGAPRHLRDHHARPVAHQGGVEVLVEIPATGDRTRVQAALVGEDRGADVGLLRVGGDVDELGDVVGHRRQPLHAVGGDGADVEFEGQVGDRRGQVGVARPLAVAVDAPLHLGGPGAHRGERVRHRHAGVVVAVDAERDVAALADPAHDLLHAVGQRAAVRVAEHECLGSRPLGGSEHGQSEVLVVEEPVEEVLGVEEHPTPVAAQERDRVGHHGDGLVEIGAQGIGHMAVPALGHDADRRGLDADQPGERLVVGRLHPGAAGRAEGHQGGRAEGELLRGALEELVVLRVGPRPPALDEGDAEVVELLGDAQLVVDRKRQAFLLATVAQCRVEDVDRARECRQLVVVALGVVGVCVLSRHNRASPCSGRPGLARWRSRPLGSPW